MCTSVGIASSFHAWNFIMCELSILWAPLPLYLTLSHFYTHSHSHTLSLSPAMQLPVRAPGLSWTACTSRTMRRALPRWSHSTPRPRKGWGRPSRALSVTSHHEKVEPCSAKAAEQIVRRWREGSDHATVDHSAKDRLKLSCSLATSLLHFFYFSW